MGRKLDVEGQATEAWAEENGIPWDIWIDLPQEMRELIRALNYLVDRYAKVVGEIPECKQHGHCIPWAKEWVKKARLYVDDDGNLRGEWDERN